MDARATPAAKTRLRGVLVALGVAALLMIGAPVRANDVVVIVNKLNPNAVDLEFVRRVYSGSLRGWPDGSPVLAFDQAEDAAVREQFCSTVMRKSMANLKAIWSQNIFTGKGLPPKVVSPDAEVKRRVASDRQAIGYILRSQLDDTVRVVTP